MIRLAFWSTFETNHYFIYLGSATPQPLTLRVRRAIDYLDMPYQLRYIGQPELGKIYENYSITKVKY